MNDNKVQKLSDDALDQVSGGGIGDPPHPERRWRLRSRIWKRRSRSWKRNYPRGELWSSTTRNFVFKS